MRCLLLTVMVATGCAAGELSTADEPVDDAFGESVSGVVIDRGLGGLVEYASGRLCFGIGDGPNEVIIPAGCTAAPGDPVAHFLTAGRRFNASMRPIEGTAAGPEEGLGVARGAVVQACLANPAICGRIVARIIVATFGSTPLNRGEDEMVRQRNAEWARCRDEGQCDSPEMQAARDAHQARQAEGQNPGDAPAAQPENPNAEPPAQPGEGDVEGPAAQPGADDQDRAGQPGDPDEGRPGAQPEDGGDRPGAQQENGDEPADPEGDQPAEEPGDEPADQPAEGEPADQPAEDGADEGGGEDECAEGCDDGGDEWADDGSDEWADDGGEG